MMFGRRKNPAAVRQRPERRRHSAGLSLLVEGLEARALLSAAADTAAGVLRPNLEVLGPAATTSTVDGFTPAQIRKAYGFDQITFANGTVPADGRGQTIAIVDA